MKIRADIDHRDVRSLLARTLAGSDALEEKAAATANADLRMLLRHAARRRLARAGPVQVPPLPGGDPEAAGSGAAAGVAAEAAPRLLRRQQVSGSLLRLEVSRPAGFDYRPGQHVKMGLPGLMRTYSLASAPHQQHLEFFVELFAGGRLSARLPGLAPGTELALGSRAKGKLALDGSRRTQLMVATVTGIAPYVSMLRDHFQGGRGTAAAGGHRFVILHGASHADEFGYLEELGELARRYPTEVTYLPTVSRPTDPRNAAWSGARGRVDAHLDAVITRLGLHGGDTAAFACGNPDMVRNVAGIMRKRGFPTHTEPFD